MTEDRLSVGFCFCTVEFSNQLNWMQWKFIPRIWIKNQKQNNERHIAWYSKEWFIHIIMIILLSFGKYMNHEQNSIPVYLFIYAFLSNSFKLEIAFRVFACESWKLKNVKLNVVFLAFFYKRFTFLCGGESIFSLV